MKKVLIIVMTTVWFGALNATAQAYKYKNDDFSIKHIQVTNKPEIGITVWEMEVNGIAGKTIPDSIGQLDGAQVLSYVFITSLKPTDVGFNQVDGITALALTSHPDFDDTPLWDENQDEIFNNDGVVWHPHWVVLIKDDRVPGGFSVKQFKKADNTVVLPPTNPGMPMYMDSPGFPVTTNDHLIRVVVPNYRINHQSKFRYDGVTAFLQVNTSNKLMPMLGVYDVFSIASNDLSLPFGIKN